MRGARRPRRAAALLLVIGTGAAACSPDDPDPVEITFPPTSLPGPAAAPADPLAPPTSAAPDADAAAGGAGDGAAGAGSGDPAAAPTSTTLPPAVTSERAELERARQRWTDAAIQDYEWVLDDLQAFDGSGSPGERVVTVVGGSVANVTDAAGEPLEVGPPLTVDDWFRFLGLVVDDADRFEVVYDEANGTPAYVDLDPDAASDGDEVRVVARAFTPLDLTLDERQDEVGADEGERLAAARETWQTFRDGFLPNGYVVTFDARCNICDNRGAQTVTVVDGEAITPTPDTGIGVTVEQWFDYLAFVSGNVDRLEVGYDPSIGVPFLIDVDLNRNVDGDEYRMDLVDIVPYDPVAADAGADDRGG